MSSRNAPLHILIAALDWGMGHISRCIPIIKQLREEGHMVTIAGNLTQQQIINQEFTNLDWLDLPGYEVRFPAASGMIALIPQFPRIRAKIRAENAWLIGQIATKNWDVIISDNRFGFYHPSVLSIFITHQLAPRSGFGPFADWVAQNVNYRLINHFDCCWVPDFGGEPNLAAELSHPRKLPAIPVHYIGPLSRFEKNNADSKVNPDSLLVMLSGPEPQRTEFEALMLQESLRCGLPITLLLAKPGASPKLSPDQIKFIEAIPHLPTVELEKKLSQANWVISRTGYSTLMDLFALEKKAILIPTPGQPEQEYLAEIVGANHWGLVVKQKEFRLDESLQKAKSQLFQKMDRSQSAQDFTRLIKVALESKKK